MIIRRLIVPLIAAVVTVHAGQALAQSAFPAPLPNGGIIKNDPAFPPPPGQTIQRNDPAFPPVNGAATFRVRFRSTARRRSPARSSNGAGRARRRRVPRDECMKEFMPLREDAEKRGKMIKAASDRHAPPQEACKLIGNFGQAEIKMIKYVESHAAKCGIPPQVADQLKNGHKNTEKMLKQVCEVAQQAQTRGPAGPSLSEVLGSSAALPEATPTKKGGSTFDTLNGNVLTR